MTQSLRWKHQTSRLADVSKVREIPLPCTAVILMGYVRDAIDNMSESLAMRMRTATATKLNVKQGTGHGERFRVDSHRKEGHGVQEHRH